MTSELSVSRSLFPWGYSALYNLKLEGLPDYLPLLVDSVIRNICDPLLLQEKPILNLKGRDPKNLINPEIPAHLLPRDQEFLFISGRISDKPLKRIKLREAMADEDFNISLFSQFIDSGTSPQMLHAAAPQIRGPFPQDIPWQMAPRLLATEIEYFRLGLDIFESRQLGALFGMVPTVTQSLLIECTQKTLLLQISANGLSSKKALPLGRDDLLKRISESVRDAAGFELEKDYLKKIS